MQTFTETKWNATTAYLAVKTCLEIKLDTKYILGKSIGTSFNYITFWV